MVKNIVITGASGRLGSAFLKHFSRSAQVKVFPVSTQNKEGLYSYNTLFTDIFLQQTDVILHLAWSSVPKVSEDNFGGEWLEDLPLLVRMLRAIKSGGHDHIHLVFFSSAGTVYGKLGNDIAAESMPCTPANMYGWSKLQAEQLLQQFAIRFPVPLSILRISNVYGIGSRKNDQQGIIPLIVKAALSDSELCIWGNGTAQKDYLYIDDLMTVIEVIIRERTTGLFNVCFGHSYSLRDLILRVEVATGKSIKLKYASAPAWDNDHVFIDGEKLRKRLDWKPLVDIDDGIARVFESLLSRESQIRMD